MREKLEQLRALEAGMRIDVSIIDEVPFGVDTPADLERARAILGRNGLEGSGLARKRVVFQGEPGANSHIACLEVFPDASRFRSRPSRIASRRSPPARPISA